MAATTEADETSEFPYLTDGLWALTAGLETSTSQFHIPPNTQPVDDFPTTQLDMDPRFQMFLPGLGPSPLESGSLFLSSQASSFDFFTPSCPGATPNVLGEPCMPGEGMDDVAYMIGGADVDLAMCQYPEHISPAEPLFPIGVQGISDETYNAGAFPTMDHLAALLASVPQALPEAEPPAESYVCQTCGSTFGSRSGLGKHEKTHTRPYECLICGLRHGAERDKNRHMWTQHAREARRMGIPAMTERCPHCGKEARKDNLKRHMRTQHKA